MTVNNRSLKTMTDVDYYYSKIFLLFYFFVYVIFYLHIDVTFYVVYFEKIEGNQGLKGLVVSVFALFARHWLVVLADGKLLSLLFSDFENIYVVAFFLFCDFLFACKCWSFVKIEFKVYKLLFKIIEYLLYLLLFKIKYHIFKN